MHDPLTLAFSVGSWLDIWHKDPERGGSDDSCDWFGHHRPLDQHEKALADAIWRAENVFGNRPFYGAEPGSDLHRAYEGYRAIVDAKYEWRRRHGWRWHPRWHVHHWRLRFWPLIYLRRMLFTRCSVCGGRFRYGETGVSDWAGSRLEHLRHSVGTETTEAKA